MQGPAGQGQIQPSAEILVFHTGALGDTVILWPLLRALSSLGKVAYLTGAGKAKLAQYCLPEIIGLDGDTPEFSRLFVPEAVSEISDRTHGLLKGARYVISLVSNGHDAWAKNMWKLADEAHHYHVDFKPPAGRVIHVLDYVMDQLERQGLRLSAIEPDLRWVPDGPVMIHPGSGSQKKNWNFEAWESLLEHLKITGREACVILGEVEREQWDEARLKWWRERYLVIEPESPIDLCRSLNGASLFIGNDSGVSHLAGQMGLRVLSLFGPTDPGVWSSTGPGVQVLWSGNNSSMSWLSLERVIEQLGMMG